MNIYNEKKEFKSKELRKIIKQIRKKRDFKPKTYIQEKAFLLNEYATEHGLKTMTIGMSGGIDSAITLGIIYEAMKQPNSNIEKIIPIYLPIDTNGMSNQEDSLNRATETTEKYGLKLINYDLTAINNNIISNLDNDLGITSDGWSKGQLVAYTRTPILYYVTTLMAQSGQRGIICGTTNRDEGAYIGYIGKASDAMVDIQLIADIHKSEVFKVAKALKLPKSVINAKPSGDMYDSREDEDVFGTTYDFVELYSNYLNDKSIVKKLSKKATKEFKNNEENILKLHNYNKHKYLACSQAVHLDVIDATVNGGWKYNTYKTVNRNFINQVNFPNELIEKFDKNYIPKNKTYSDIMNLLKSEEIDLLHEFMNKQTWQNVGIDGIVSNYKKGDIVGSKRLSIYSEELAKLLWKRIKKSGFETNVIAERNTSLEVNNHWKWKGKGLNPLFRFIRYDDGNMLINHYDTGFTYGDNDKTLKTFVLYLTNNESGLTRFFQDEQDRMPFSERDFSDKLEQGSENKIIRTSKPEKGKALIFNHRELHDCATVKGETKIIIRSDIIYKKA